MTSRTHTGTIQVISSPEPHVQSPSSACPRAIQVLTALCVARSSPRTRYILTLRLSAHSSSRPYREIDIRDRTPMKLDSRRPLTLRLTMSFKTLLAVALLATLAPLSNAATCPTGYNAYCCVAISGSTAGRCTPYTGWFVLLTTLRWCRCL
jgi:hypothetical protein